MPYTPPPNTPNAGLAFFAGMDQAQQNRGAQQEQRERQRLSRLQAQAQTLTLQQAMKRQEDDEAFRRELAGLGPNASIDDKIKIAGKYSDPQRYVEFISKLEERREAQEQRVLQAANNLDLRRQQLDLQRDQAIQRTQDEAERRRIMEQYNTARLENQQAFGQLNTQLRAMGLELQRNGQQLQLQRFNAEERERRDKAVTGFANELQQNKLPALSSSMSTANDLLRQYEDKDIPGMGLFIGSKNIPNWMRSEDANKTRSAVQAVSNDLLNLYSGLAVTLPEAERRELEEMRGGSFDDKDFRNAWPRIVKRYNTVVGNLRAGQNAEVLREYQSRPGAMSLNPIAPAFGAPRPQGASPARPAVPPPPPGFSVVAP